MNKSQDKAQELLDLLFKLTKEIHPHFHKKAILMEDNLENDLGLDSLSRVELISRVQEHFKIDIVEEDLYEIQSPKELLEAIFGGKETSSYAYKNISTLSIDESSDLPYEANTLIDVLHWHLKRHPDRLHIQMYEDDNSGKGISYAKLYENALRIASSLQKLGLMPKEAVAIMLPTCAEYFYSFYAILLAGGIPVPIYPPARPSQLEEHMKRHTRILENAQASILITIPEAKIVAKLLKAYVQDLSEIVTPETLLDSEPSVSLPPVHKDDIAFIQYTSGSTGDPKGVVLSHANLLANIRAMGESVEASSKDVFVSWLPLYHDMGLIGSWLGSIYHASLFVVMSPLAFLSKPQRWLWAIHKYKGTLSASPNFAYEYCLHRLKGTDLEGLDLSSWRLAFNGAEAVSPLSMKNFCEHFKKYGFNEKAMTPVYGLAESSVGLVFPPLNRGPLIDHIQRDLFMKDKIAKKADAEAALDFVSSGYALRGHEIRIIDSYGNELPPRQEGALQFKGPSSTRGYYRNPQKSKELMDGTWLNTGDQAYIAEGELYITGRVKDIIIRAGRNIYPDQLEKAIGLIDGIRKGCTAIFGGRDERSGTERLIILSETKVKDKELREKLIQEISTLSTELLGSPPDEICLGETGSVLKTSSGKIRRSATKDLYAVKGGKAESQNLFLQLLRLFSKSIFPNIKRLYRYIKVHIFSVYHWFIFSACIISAWIFVMIFPSSLAQKISKLHIKLLSSLGLISIKIEGLENLQDRSIIVLNHSSYLDSLVLFLSLRMEISFIAKAELKKYFYTRVPLEKLGIRFVQRYQTGQSIKDAKALLDYKDIRRPLVFFPEGTFTHIPGLRSFHMGAFSLAVQKDLSLTAICIKGTRSILKANSWMIRKGKISLYISKPIYLHSEQKDLSTWEKALFLKDKSRTFILKYSNEPDLQKA